VSFELYHGDCLELMKLLAYRSVDLVLCDLPYGTTQNKWDSIIPFDALWKEYGRVVKENAALVFTSSQPFTSALVESKREWFKYEWIWKKK
jgi:site-specific DNA-methyltransferase (adenine-specific)